MSAKQAVYLGTPCAYSVQSRTIILLVMPAFHVLSIASHVTFRQASVRGVLLPSLFELTI